MKILISGFEPFGGEKINPSAEAVKRLPDIICGAKIIKTQIPTVYKKSVNILASLIETEKPDAVINVGQAGGRADISIERIGINCDDFKIADNEGNRPIDEKIYPDGDDAYFCTLPVKAIADKIRSGGIPASVSNTAGTYVCNHVCYAMAYLRNRKYPNMRTGFIHIPFIPSQAINHSNAPSMSLDDIIKALTLAIEAVLENDSDLKKSEGKTH